MKAKSLKDKKKVESDELMTILSIQDELEKKCPLIYFNSVLPSQKKKMYLYWQKDEDSMDDTISAEIQDIQGRTSKRDSISFTVKAISIFELFGKVSKEQLNKILKSYCQVFVLSLSVPKVKKTRMLKADLCIKNEGAIYLMSLVAF